MHESQAPELVEATGQEPARPRNRRRIFVGELPEPTRDAGAPRTGDCLSGPVAGLTGNNRYRAGDTRSRMLPFTGGYMRASEGATLRDAGTYWERLDRTARLYGRPALERLQKARVAVAGCGGVGGAIADMLARLGVGALRLADPGEFDSPDMNRQWGARVETLGRNKADVHAESVRAMQPDIEVTVVAGGIAEANVEDFLDGADLLVDGLDVNVPPALRGRLYDGAWAKGTPTISTPILGFGALVAVSLRSGLPMSRFGAALAATLASGRLPPKLSEVFAAEHLAALGRGLLESRPPSHAIAPAVAAAFACTEAVMILAGDVLPGGRPPIALPEVGALDLASMRMARLQLSDLGS